MCPRYYVSYKGSNNEYWHLPIFLGAHLTIENNSKLVAAVAAAAKSLQSCSTLCDPKDSSPPGSSVHRIIQARVLEWVV